MQFMQANHNIRYADTIREPVANCTWYETNSIWMLDIVLKSTEYGDGQCFNIIRYANAKLKQMSIWIGMMKPLFSASVV